MKYMLVAGEASGDLHASRLMEWLKRVDADAEFRFIGGDRMADVAGKAPDLHYRQLNVMGFSEVLRKLPAIFSALRKGKKLMAEFQPDRLILVDYPGFNLKMAKAAWKRGVAVDWYISPKVWAWKEWRVKSLKKYVDYMYSILPFEPEFYRERGFDRISYVGNPSVEEIDGTLKLLPARNHFIERAGLDPSKPIIALLPGSRRGEIRCNLPVMIKAAKRFPEFQMVVAAAPSMPEKFYREVARDPGLQVVFESTVTLLKYSTAALVTSGTATMETALVGTPQVVCYRSNGSKLTYKIMRKLIHVDFVSLPNLIAGERVVPELLLHDCTPEKVAYELSPLLLNSPGRENQTAGYKLIRKRLGTDNAPQKAAAIIYERASRREDAAPRG
ncbi:MAG: lipid-A-disaccharide synthase [Muribaculaceae bacterium]|nr:lipid-A-disaccharide synthase [Muribaculaceae bacterium]